MSGFRTPSVCPLFRSYLYLIHKSKQSKPFSKILFPRIYFLPRSNEVLTGQDLRSPAPDQNHRRLSDASLNPASALWSANVDWGASVDSVEDDDDAETGNVNVVCNGARRSSRLSDLFDRNRQRRPDKKRWKDKQGTVTI